jgi:hypothetical protein
MVLKASALAWKCNSNGDGVCFIHGILGKKKKKKHWFVGNHGKI